MRALYWRNVVIWGLAILMSDNDCHDRRHPQSPTLLMSSCVALCQGVNQLSLKRNSVLDGDCLPSFKFTFTQNVYDIMFKISSKCVTKYE